MEKSSFFNSVNHDRRYKAEDWAEFFASFIGNGVFPSPSIGLQAAAASGMTITVRPGKAWINGYFYCNTSDLNITLDNADGVLKRIDRLVLRLDFQARSIKAAVKKGAFLANPVPQPLQRSSDVYEICLCDIAVNAGVTQITQAVITDRRMDASLCGIVTGMLEEIDTTNLFAQYEAAFTEWFDEARTTLNEDTAGNLFTLVEQAAPVGSIIMFAGAAAPKGHLLCQGQTISRTGIYANLFAAIGTAYGAGNGSTTFTLPDLRTRVPVGMSSGDADFNALGKSGGSKNMQQHNHSFTGEAVTSGNQSAGHTHTTPAATSGGQSADHTHAMQSHTHTMAHTHPGAVHHHDSADGWRFVTASGAISDSYGASTWSSSASRTAPTVSTNSFDAYSRYTDYCGPDYQTSAGTTGASSAGSTGAPSNNTTAGMSAGHTHSVPAVTTGAQSASHTHSVTTSGSVGTTGSGAAQNLQPYITMNYIIKY
jgi:microcystin-dependent protein